MAPIPSFVCPHAEVIEQKEYADRFRSATGLFTPLHVCAGSLTRCWTDSGETGRDACGCACGCACGWVWKVSYTG